MDMRGGAWKDDRHAPDDILANLRGCREGGGDDRARRHIETVEGLADHHLLLARVPDPSDAQIREAISGNLCRCTGYKNIVTAVRAAARSLAATMRS